MKIEKGTPSLISLDNNSVITDPISIIFRIIRYTLYNPGNITAFNKDGDLSFRKLETRYGDDYVSMSNNYQKVLSDILTNYFGTKYNPIVSADTKSDGSTHIAISVQENNNNMLDLGYIRMKPGGVYEYFDMIR